MVPLALAAALLGVPIDAPACVLFVHHGDESLGQLDQRAVGIFSTDPGKHSFIEKRPKALVGHPSFEPISDGHADRVRTARAGSKHDDHAVIAIAMAQLDIAEQLQCEIANVVSPMQAPDHCNDHLALAATIEIDTDPLQGLDGFRAQ